MMSGLQCGKNGGHRPKNKGDSQNNVHRAFSRPKKVDFEKQSLHNRSPDICLVNTPPHPFVAAFSNGGLPRSRFSLLWPKPGGLFAPTGTHEAWYTTTPNTHENTTKALCSPQRAERAARPFVIGTTDRAEVFLGSCNGENTMTMRRRHPTTILPCC